jgi:hypothetical protein
MEEITIKKAVIVMVGSAAFTAAVQNLGNVAVQMI